MANPYHDAEGKFCSRSEMQGAIEIAQKDGDFDTYFRLRTDFEAAEADPKNIFEDRRSTKEPKTAAEVETAVTAYQKQQRSEGSRFVFAEDLEYVKDLQIPGLGKVEYVGEGGGGIGDTNTIIHYFKVDDYYYSISGYYSSYDGTDWSSAHFARVEPQVVNTVVYHYVKD